MMIMLLIERSEYDDDDVADRKVKVLMMMMFLIERLECDDDDVLDRKIRV